MTLADELRNLADEHQHPLVGWEQRLVGKLRQAATQIEELENELLKESMERARYAKALGHAEDAIARQAKVQAADAAIREAAIDALYATLLHDWKPLESALAEREALESGEVLGRAEGEAKEP